MKRHTILCVILSAGLIGLSEGCRGKGETMNERRRQDPVYRGDQPDWDEQEWENAPDTERTPQPVFDPDYAPDTLPSPARVRMFAEEAPEKAMYATDVVMLADCQQWASTASVAKEHSESAVCEKIIPIAAQNDDGDFYEVGMPFAWTVYQPEAIELQLPFGTQNNYGVPIGLADLFDADGDEEPSSIIQACAINDCPIPRPQDCEDSVCASVLISSVVNIEGDWLIQESNLQDKKLTLTQDGRSFEDATLEVIGGNIQNRTVNFKLGPYLYTGLLTPDRAGMSGAKYESATSLFVSPWSALRISP